MKKAIFAMSILLFTSCELPFNLKDMGDKDMIKLCCEVVPGDTTVVDVDVLVPVGYHDRTPAKLESVVMTADGKEIVLSTAAEDDPDLEPGTLYVVEDFPYGSEICIKASAEGAEPVEARTVVPLSLDGFRLDMELTDMISSQVYGQEVKNIVKARLTLPEVAEGTRIGIEYIVRSRVDSCGVAKPEDVFLNALYDVCNFSSDGTLGTNADFLHLQQMGSGRYVWEGTDEYEFIFYYPMDSSSEWPDEQGNIITWSYDYDFCFRIFAFSEEYYRYYSRATNDFFELGMASPSYTYTNVKGGTGFLGAVNSIDTPWMDEKVFDGNDAICIQNNQIQPSPSLQVTEPRGRALCR